MLLNGCRLSVNDIVKVPKQICWWAYKAGLRPYKPSLKSYRRPYNWKGHGRHWRINMHGQFQVSETYDTFDRWANSVQETWGMPKYEHEFLTIVEQVNNGS